MAVQVLVAKKDFSYFLPEKHPVKSLILPAGVSTKNN